MPITHSPEIEKLSTALAKAQGQIEDAVKDAKNPAFKQGGKESKYADLASVRAAIREPLSTNGLSYVQFPEADGNKVSCETMLMHDSGQWMRGTLVMQATQMTPQAIGSAITYCRRYSLMAVVGIAPAEDDDGNEASGKVPNDNSVRVSSSPAASRPQQTPFDEAPTPKAAVEPAVSTKAIALGREMRDCRSIPDLNAFKKTEEFKAAFDAMNAVDQKYLRDLRDKLAEDLKTADLRMAG